MIGRKTNESHVQFKHQIEELEIKIHACQRSEELAINELHKIKDKYAKSEHLYEKVRSYQILDNSVGRLLFFSFPRQNYVMMNWKKKSLRYGIRRKYYKMYNRNKGHELIS